ncbi:hypothetical protein BD410DRAFT_273292 [Rickenella mellea]|uniref:Uncharacterized protein n=1 Tax=Rickenella mellea TaxID=50990 RepID=A0A4Y7Q4E5_9AGAM|nr:hypothetical protein BD410DRAFT_273292 [Rickenella mellea]
MKRGKVSPHNFSLLLHFARQVLVPVTSSFFFFASPAVTFVFRPQFRLDFLRTFITPSTPPKSIK